MVCIEINFTNKIKNQNKVLTIYYFPIISSSLQEAPNTGKSALNYDPEYGLIAVYLKL